MGNGREGMAMRLRTVGLWVLRLFVYAGFFAALFYLFSQQSTGAFPSDLPAHLRPATADTYSASHVFYTALIGDFGLSGVCVFLALAELGTVAVTEYLIRKLSPGAKPLAALLLALACNFAIAIYIPVIQANFTVGSPGGNCWHNSTYTVMRLLALLALVFYLKFDGKIKSNSKAVSWLAFTVFLVLATLVKPSFAIVFGPAVFVLCLVDLKREGVGSVRKSLMVGLSLAIALVVVCYQLVILFPSGTDSEGGIAFGLAKVWRARHHNVFVSFFQSLAFPLLVAALVRKQVWEDKRLLLAMLMAIVAMAEYVFLYETGERTYHGNFGWGLTFAIFYLFVIAVCAYINNRGSAFGLAETRSAHEAADGLHACPDCDEALVGQGRNALDWAIALAFLLHTASGVWYFVRLMMGASYY